MGGGETTTDAAFINMDDFGEGLGARPLLTRRACQVPPSVPPRIGLSGCCSRSPVPVSVFPPSFVRLSPRTTAGLQSNLFPSGGAGSPRPVASGPLSLRC